MTVHDADSCPVTIKLAGYRTMDATLHNGAGHRTEADWRSRRIDGLHDVAGMRPKEARKAYEKAAAAMVGEPVGRRPKEL